MDKERQSCVCLSGKSLRLGIPTRKVDSHGKLVIDCWWNPPGRRKVAPGNRRGEKGLQETQIQGCTSMQCWSSGWYSWGWWQFICCLMSRVSIKNMHPCAQSGLQHCTQSRFYHASKPGAITRTNDNFRFARKSYLFDKTIASNAIKCSLLEAEVLGKGVISGFSGCNSGKRSAFGRMC